MRGTSRATRDKHGQHTLSAKKRRGKYLFTEVENTFPAWMEAYFLIIETVLKIQHGRGHIVGPHSIQINILIERKTIAAIQAEIAAHG